MSNPIINQDPADEQAQDVQMITCSYCPAKVGIRQLQDPGEYLKALGWSLSGTHWFCPVCRPLLTKENTAACPACRMSEIDRIETVCFDWCAECRQGVKP